MRATLARVEQKVKPEGRRRFSSVFHENVPASAAGYLPERQLLSWRATGGRPA